MWTWEVCFSGVITGYHIPQGDAIKIRHASWPSNSNSRNLATESLHLGTKICVYLAFGAQSTFSSKGKWVIKCILLSMKYYITIKKTEVDLLTQTWKAILPEKCAEDNMYDVISV